MSKVTLRPLGLRIIIRPDLAPTKIGGIFLPDKVQSKEPSRRGTIVAVGERVTEVKAGDAVVYPPFVGNDVEANGERLTIALEQDVLGVVDDAEQTKVADYFDGADEPRPAAKRGKGGKKKSNG
jgi:chaperonin GroES